MENYFARVSDKVQNHLKQLAGTVRVSGADGSNADPLELLAQAWLEKEERFNRQLEDNNMELVEMLDADDEKGGVVLTYSGSLLTVGPLIDGGRRVEYASVGLRTDVPDSAEQEGSTLARDITVDHPAEFRNGPLQKSSPVYRIAVCKEALEPEEEEEVLADVTRILIEEFAEVNKTLIVR
jgi:hypothetical protein